MSQTKEHYVCNYSSCRKIFARKFDWNRHLDGHLGINYHCDKCEKGFSRRYTLDQHIRSCKGKTGPATSIDATIIAVTPVLPIAPLKTSYEKPFNDAPPKIINRSAWAESGASSSTNKAIRILSKYKQTGEIYTPQPGPGAKAQVSPLPNINERWPQPHIVPIIQPNQAAETDAFTRRPTLPMAHASDQRMHTPKRVSFGPNLIPAPPPPKREGFKPTPGKKRRLEVNTPTSVSTPLKNTPASTMAKPAQEPFSKKLKLPETSTKIQPRITNQVTPQVHQIAPSTQTRHSYQNLLDLNPVIEEPNWQTFTMDGPGGSPFTQEPDCPKDEVWDGLFDTPDQMISPISSPPSLARDFLPSPTKVNDKIPSPTTVKVALEKIRPVSHDLAKELIGTISDSSNESNAATVTTKVTEMLPKVSEEANGIILDIISEMSIVNEASMQRDLSHKTKALKKILKKLQRITNSL